jgi:acetyl esterase/lipase
MGQFGCAGSPSRAAAPAPRPAEQRTPQTIHIAGDSTAAEFPPSDPRVGWGAVLGAELDGVRVNDAARSGRSSKSYIDEGLFRQLETQLAPGDLVLIEFGHNDEKDDPVRHTDAATSFRDNLRRYVSACRARGAVPVLLTPICRRRFTGQRVTPTHGDYPDATRAVAYMTSTPLVDLTLKTAEVLERFGPDTSKQLFAPDDNTHLSLEGAHVVARLVVDGLIELGFELKPHARAPALTYHPANTSTPSAAVVICPGGGYTHLSLEKEGSEAAAWLNGLGIAAFVLRYRLADYGHPAPLDDVTRALGYVRARSRELGIAAQRVGVLGFSAGGHLAACASNLIDDPAARPDFAVLLYPVVTFKDPYAHVGSRRALLGAEPNPTLVDELSLETRVTARTPHTFLMHTKDDASVPVENSLLYAAALTRAGVPHELALYEHGPHGIGLRPEHEAGREWPKACAAWLRARGLLIG